MWISTALNARLNVHRLLRLGSPGAAAGGEEFPRPRVGGSVTQSARQLCASVT